MQTFTYYTIRTLWHLASHLPLAVLYLLSDIIYYPLYHIARYRRKIVRTNLQRSFPDKSLKEIINIEKRFYSAFCDYVVETVKLMSMSQQKIKEHLHFEGTEEVERMVAEGKSCVVYMGHNFNWEYVTSLPLHFDNPGIQFGQIYHPLANKAMDRLFLELRNQYGAESISMNNTLRRILELNSQKKPFVIGFIADQVPHWEAISLWMPFFNQDTPVFTGPERIACKTRSAVFYMSLRKEKRGCYVATFHKLADDAGTFPENELTKRYFQLLEDKITESPELWLWTHKRWKRTREKYAEWNAKRIKRLQEKISQNDNNK